VRQRFYRYIAVKTIQVINTMSNKVFETVWAAAADATARMRISDTRCAAA